MSFEARTGAVALCRLLRGDRVAGLDTPPLRVRLQQRVAGAVLDDVLFDALDPRGGDQSIEYQVKRTMSITASDPNFADLIRRCWTELENNPAPIDNRRRRFGIASRPTPALAEFDRVVRAARAHDTADGFFQVLHNSANREVRARLEALRQVVASLLPDGATDAAVNDAAWRVAKSLHVWPVDAEPDTEDVRAAWDRLSDLLRTGRAESAFAELVAVAQDLATQAGSVSVDMLRARLETSGFALDDTPARRLAFSRLASVSRPLLDPVAARLGHRLHLPRPGLRRQIRDALEEDPIVVLAGPAGVGKSIAARLAANDLAETGAAVVAVNLSGRGGPLALLEQELGASLSEGLAGAPIGGLRLLVVDGAEQALTDSGHLLAAVLGALPVEPGSAPPWRVQLTAREEALPTLVRLIEDRTGIAPRVVRVEELVDDEVERVIEEFPRLTPVARNPRARSLLLSRPYLVELLVRATGAVKLPDGLQGEEDVLRVVNDRLIRRDRGGLPGRGAPYARADIFIQLGDAVIENKLPVRLDGTDPEARAGLASDDIITEIRSSWRFAHDILADYAAAARLLEPDGDNRLAGAPHPRRLLRSARLRHQYEFADTLACRRFQTAWYAAHRQADQLADRDGPRWRDVPWEALLHLGAARAAIDELAGDLLANDGASLLRLIDVTMRRARRSHNHGSDAPALDTTMSAPVADFLVAHAGQVPAAATAASSRLVHQHLDAAAAGAGSAEIQHIADLPDAMVGWAGDDRWGERLEHALGALALSAAVLQDRHETFLIGHAKSRPGEIAEAVEAPRPVRQLAASRPELLLRLAGLYYLGRGLTVNGEGEDVGVHPRSHAMRDEGIGDHSPRHSGHVAATPLGNNQANPALGPFAALLDGSPAHGLRLIGALVDQATAARARLEASHRYSDDPSPGLELSSPGWPQVRRYNGPGTVWCWHRRTSVGPGPALSALMALRAWAVTRIKAGDSPREVRDTILSAGGSLAFVSVAVSVLVDRIDDVTDELDLFLVHPLIWRLEGARTAQERGLALEIPEATRLSWNLSNVAMMLVLRADEQRRQRLRQLGQELMANHCQLGSADGELLARRWAAELDIDLFVAEPHDEGVAVSVNYPTGLVDALRDSGGGAAERSLQLAGTTMHATQMRDGERDLSEAAAVWTTAVTGCEQQSADGDGYGLYNPGDVLSAAGSALVLAAHAGHAVDDSELRRAVTFLLEGAAYFAQVAPPEAADTSESSDGRRALVADMLWDVGADRSICVALPALLLDASLRERAGVAIEAVVDALEGVAATPYDEARTRLVQHLLPSWSRPCGDSQAHRAALGVACRLIATEGMARRTDRYGYLPVMLAEPLEETIRASSGMSFDVGGASFGAILVAAARCDCSHGRAAHRLIEALIDYDHRVWPAEYARHHYHRTFRWRNAIDAAVADRVMSGDDDALEAHLDALAPVGEELRGFLGELVGRATDGSAVSRLHEVWPRILDRLLPTARNLGPSDTTSDRSPFHHDVEDLDRALLLLPTDSADWPLEDTVRLGGRWLGEYRARPHVADRAIFFMANTFGVRHDMAIQLVLNVLGDDVGAIRHSSAYTISWLKAVLTDPPAGAGAARARVLLDRMAATGDEAALRLQAELEA